MTDTPETSGLCVKGVRKSFGRGGTVEVLHGVDLVVPAGGLTAVLGASGCGKTTLLRLVAGFDDPDDGTITIAQREVAGPWGALPPEQRRIGYVTQEGNLFPHLTVAGNVVFGLPRRARRARHRVAELLELVGLDTGYAGRYPHQLSGGQQQRVALARALAPEPGIVLLDEPFSALDVSLREATRRAVADALAAAGTTTVLVTHDQAEALSLAGRVAVMRDGVIVQEAEPGELYRNPVDRAVAAFVGDLVTLPATVHGGVAECALGTLPVAGPAANGFGTALLRPEQITLDADADAHADTHADTHAGAQGAVPARVLGIEFYGHDAVVRLRLTADVRVTARWPGHLLPGVGSDVRVGVHGAVRIEPAGRTPPQR